MTTPRTRAIVSLAAAMTLTLAFGACVPGPSRLPSERPASVAARRLAIRFDNDAREHVHVYLIGEQREWLLGRVEPGARAALPIPEASLDGGPGLVRLAVLAGGRLTLQASRDARARVTVQQPASAILSQRWMFAQGQLTSLRLGWAGADAGRP